jgi:hypothetical protein
VVVGFQVFWIRRGRAGFRDRDIEDVRSRRFRVSMLGAGIGYVFVFAAIALAMYVWGVVHGVRGGLFAAAIALYAAGLSSTFSYLIRRAAGMVLIPRRGWIQLMTLGWSLVIGTLCLVLGLNTSVLFPAK